MEVVAAAAAGKVLTIAVSFTQNASNKMTLRSLDRAGRGNVARSRFVYDAISGYRGCRCVFFIVGK